jgi:outer membrane protein OmpA-like peptidoglycan-associated protein
VSSKAGGDAFAPKAKPAKPLPGIALAKRPKAPLAPPLKPPAKPVRQPTKTAGKISPLTPVHAAQARRQKMTAPTLPKPAAKLTKAAPGKAPGLKDPFGRKEAKAQRQKALVPASSVAPSSPLTKPLVKPPFAKPLPPMPPKGARDEPVRQTTPMAVEPPVVPEKAKADAARAPLQIVANESVLDHTGFRKFRRAARSSSLVLVSAGVADAVASADTLEAVSPEAVLEVDGASIRLTAADDPDALVADKPVNPPTSPAGPATAAEPAAATTGGGDGPAPPSIAKVPDPVPPPSPPEAPDPAPEVVAAGSAPGAEAAAVIAEKPVEVVEAIVEPPSSVPFDTASVPADQLASGPKREPVAGTAGAVETSWQDVAGANAAEGQPAAAVLRKMETAPVSGYWNGATSGAKSTLTRRGFNQDDIFGVVFGIAVLAFLLLWFVRGRGEETPAGDLLATPQSTTGQSLAALSPPAPASKVDPFGDAPVNLKPTGPVPDASPADPQVASVTPPAATPAPAAPLAASPPVLAANPETAIPIDERKMHAWFCTASSRMTKSSRAELKGQMAKFEDVFAGKELVVRGYADTRGSNELNADLGSRRAQTVASYLTAKGLSVVDVQGVGELNGLDDNQNCPNQRRVDVWVKGGPAETPSRDCAPEPDVKALVCG